MSNVHQNPSAPLEDFPVEIDASALKQLRSLIERKGNPESFVRVGVKGGGCSGLEYVLRLDEKHTPHDQETAVDGIKIVCDAKSAMYLKGSRLIYTGNLIGGGFIFENPNAQKSCGCGTSFTPSKQ